MSESGRKPRAFIAWGWPHAEWDNADHSGYHLHVENLAGIKPPMEPGPDGLSLADALAWARTRTDWIVVRPEWDPDVSYWGGPGEVPVDPDGTQLPRLPLGKP